jgi:hypothetical protein
MGKSQRAKGSRVERRILAMFNKLGFNGRRVGFLPALGIPTQGDLDINGMHVEVKARKKGEGFKIIQNWLEGNDMLVLVANNREPLIVQTMSNWAKNRNPHDQPLRDNSGNNI